MKRAFMLVGLFLGLAVVCRAGPARKTPGDLAPTAYSFARLKPLQHKAVKVDAGFWKPIRDRSRDVGVSDYLKKFEEHGYIENFRIVSQNREEAHHGGPNNNEFVYKHMEAMGYYAAESDRIAALLDELSAAVLAVQREDGYLNTFYDNPLNKKKGRKRFEKLNRFELYNFGHFTQAALAHHRATGDGRSLEAAVKFADLIVELFADPNDLPYDTYRGPPNLKYEHPNHELAMVELWRTTGNRAYLDFVAQTLREYEFFGPKFKEIRGHAVQETLLYAGATDLYLETGDRKLWEVIERLWTDMHDRKLYVIGGVGSGGRGEAYGQAYQLPNETAYCETCAAISLVFWNHKMLLATGNPKFADGMERSLYNNVLSGISLAGTQYFYVNRLRFDPSKIKEGSSAGRRLPWFGCSCCPPNVHRLLASINQYVYTQDDRGIQVNLYAGSTLETRTRDGQNLTLVQRTGYPWQPTAEFEIRGVRDAGFVLSLRIPQWCRQAAIKVNGRTLDAEVPPGTYLQVRRTWNDGDTVELSLPMPVRLVAGHPATVNKGHVAILRGPVVYCLEQIDNPHGDIFDYRVAPDAQWEATFEADRLGGVVTVTGNAKLPDGKTVRLKAIPYYTWSNRQTSAMMVWIPSGE